VKEGRHILSRTSRVPHRKSSPLFTQSLQIDLLQGEKRHVKTCGEGKGLIMKIFSPKLTYVYLLVEPICRPCHDNNF